MRCPICDSSDDAPESLTSPKPVAREWEPRQINPDGDGEIFVSGTDEMIPWTKLWPEHNALVARLREVERAAKESSDKFDASCWQRTNLEQECEALRAQLAAAVDALDRIYRVINAAGIYSLMNGVQLGQVVWCVKMQDAMAEAKEVLDATLAAKKP